jgi:hypothetical protein
MAKQASVLLAAVLSVACLIAALFFAAMPGASVAKETLARVQFIYLVPHDRQPKPAYQRAVENSALNIQQWLAEKLDGYSFDLDTPAVAIFQSSHDAAWFADNESNTARSIAFYSNAATELRQAKRLQFNDPMVRYVVYVDADLRCGQSGAGGNGVAIMSANDLRGLSGEPIVPACGTMSAAERGGKCRWIGGSAHEMLHTFGLGHSDKFDECKDAKCQQDALMMFGYTIYPNARLLDQEMQKIRNSGFVRRQAIADRSPACSN